ncbi:hypothetical protein AV530_004881 [Patagioenas fasciata monilis]|uniref:Uncharacterized protein n=1 Tax=Patagioenas fasciata monilis TaxID=372326 RepID=A0A1V4JTN8_PATFA|nr:hypothetical protein AV530_004881 [Patagioenas fasciata monilis]
MLLQLTYENVTRNHFENLSNEDFSLVMVRGRGSCSEGEKTQVLRLRMDVSHMQFLRRQQETGSFDPARTKFNSSEYALVCVPWAAISTRGYLHPSTCKKGVSDQTSSFDLDERMIPFCS